MQPPTAAALLVLAALAGCATPPPAPETPAQSWYTAKAAYDVALSAAARYRTDCLRKAERLRSRCMAVVGHLREIDREAEGIEEIGDLAHADGDDDLLEEAAAELERLRDDLEDRLLSGTDAGTGR